MVAICFNSKVWANIGLLDRQGQILSIQDLHFTDENGREVKLNTYFKEKRPVLIAPVYYGCKGVCTVTLNALFDGVKRTGLTPGRAIQILAISINPKEKPELALEKKKSYLQKYQFTDKGDGFHFLVGNLSQISKVTEELGFQYEQNGDDFEHPSAVFILGPSGKITKTLPGTHFNTRKFRQVIAAASGGRSISAFERMIYLCSRWWQRGIWGDFLNWLGLI